MKHRRCWQRIGRYAAMMLATALLLVALAAESVHAGGAVLEGQVLDQAGRPVGGYPVRVENLDKPGPPVAALTDPDGNFWLYGLPPGRYMVLPLNQGEASGRKEITIEPGSERHSVQLNVQIR